MQTKTSTKADIPLKMALPNDKRLPSLMLFKSQSAGWGIKVFLVFLIMSFSAHRLALHYYFSSKGLLLSSVIAGCFGALWWLFETQHDSKWRTPLLLASPAAVVVMLFLLMPNSLTLLFALAVSALTFGFFLRPPLPSTGRGGRSELLSLLRPLAPEAMAQSLRIFFELWFILSLLTKATHSLTQSSFVAFLPLFAFAVSMMAVHNTAAQRSSNENIAG